MQRAFAVRKRYWLPVLLLLLVPGATSASMAPTTPTFLLQWGGYGTGPGQLHDPFGIAVDAGGSPRVCRTCAVLAGPSWPLLSSPVLQD